MKFFMLFFKIKLVKMYKSVPKRDAAHTVVPAARTSANSTVNNRRNTAII